MPGFLEHRFTIEIYNNLGDVLDRGVSAFDEFEGQP
jgi:hypothetical protein